MKYNVSWVQYLGEVKGVPSEPLGLLKGHHLDVQRPGGLQGREREREGGREREREGEHPTLQSSFMVHYNAGTANCKHLYTMISGAMVKE